MLYKNRLFAICYNTYIRFLVEWARLVTLSDQRSAWCGYCV